MNLSNISLNFSNSPVSVTELKAEDIIRDFVIQVDQKVIMAILFIFIGFILYSLILPRAVLGLEAIKKSFDNKSILIVLDQAIIITKMLASLSETFAVMSGAYIILNSYYQGLLTKTHLTILWAVIGVIGLIFLTELIGFINRKIIKSKANKGASNG